MRPISSRSQQEEYYIFLTINIQTYENQVDYIVKIVKMHKIS